LAEVKWCRLPDRQFLSCEIGPNICDFLPGLRDRIGCQNLSAQRLRLCSLPWMAQDWPLVSPSFPEGMGGGQPEKRTGEFAGVGK
jgi:hypothetical protein